MTVQTRPTGGGVSSGELPKSGILMGIIVPVSITVGGTVNTPNALGMAAAIKRIVLRLNAGQTVFDVSGVAYFNLLSEFMQDNYNLANYGAGRTAVSATSFVLDFFIPVAANTRDEVGLIVLQNLQTFATLSIEWETELVVGGSTATITAGSASPLLMLCEVPNLDEDMPPDDVIHQLLEEQFVIAGAGFYDHRIPIGATLEGMYYLIPAGWTTIELRLQGSNVLATLTPAQHRMLFDLTTSRDANLTGVITGFDKRAFWDFAGTDGLGQFGSVRDFVNTQNLTDIFTRINMVGATTLYALRRQLVRLGD
jgi:hypothetical protein